MCKLYSPLQFVLQKKCPNMLAGHPSESVPGHLKELISAKKIVVVLPLTLHPFLGVCLLDYWVSLLFRAEDLFFSFFFFLLVDFFPRGGCRIYQTGGGGRRSKHWPRALETLATPLQAAHETFAVLGSVSRSKTIPIMIRES